jgi:hypothetical protein
MNMIFYWRIVDGKLVEVRKLMAHYFSLNN